METVLMDGNEGDIPDAYPVRRFDGGINRMIDLETAYCLIPLWSAAACRRFAARGGPWRCNAGVGSRTRMGELCGASDFHHSWRAPDITGDAAFSGSLTLDSRSAHTH